MHHLGLSPAEMALTERASAHLSNLVAFETLSERSNLPVIGYVESVLAPLGARVERIGQIAGKSNLLVSTGPQVSGGIALSGHTDVVPARGQKWTSDPFQMRQDGNRLYGRGTTDMLGFVALAIAALEAGTQAQLERPLHLALSYDEEVGCLGVASLVDRLARPDTTPDLVIVGEPSQMRLVGSHKGGIIGHFVLTGVPGHASNPQGLVNAIDAGSDLIQRLRRFASDLHDRFRDPRFEPPYPTFQVTQIYGGEHSNIIPAKCELAWELRILPGQNPVDLLDHIRRIASQEIELALKAQNPKAKVELVLGNIIPPLGSNGPGAAHALATRIVGTSEEIAVAYGSEAGFFQSAGIPTVICGPGNIEQAHKPDEYIELEQLALGAGLMQRVLQELTDWGVT